MANIDSELDFINRLAVECTTMAASMVAGRAEGIEAVRGLMPKVQDRHHPRSPGAGSVGGVRGVEGGMRQDLTKWRAFVEWA